jgi:hypothetical protein
MNKITYILLSMMLFGNGISFSYPGLEEEMAIPKEAKQMYAEVRASCEDSQQSDVRIGRWWIGGPVMNKNFSDSDKENSTKENKPYFTACCFLGIMTYFGSFLIKDHYNQAWDSIVGKKLGTLRVPAALGLASVVVFGGAYLLDKYLLSPGLQEKNLVKQR